MMGQHPTNTKPPGPRTGRIVAGCYAAALQDCGGTLDHEHYVSKSVLKQFGKSFTIKGLPWASTDTRVSPESLKARVLCKRHNNALSGLDEVAGRFYPLMLAALNGRHVGDHEFDGEDLERWALKLMLGVVASGNTPYAVGKLGGQKIPEEHLRVLFGERELRPNCGFKFSQVSHAEDQTALNWNLNHFAEGPQTGEIFGITIKIANWFQFLTTVTVPVDVLNGVRLAHRPTGFVIGVPEEQGHIKLRWRDRPYGGSFILRRHIVPIANTTSH
jgi:hypothetical protein